MKNRTEAGMHFDESTAIHPIVRDFDFSAGGCTVKISIVIPQRILSKLCSADFDECRLMMRQGFVQISTGVPIGARLDVNRMMMLLRLEGANFLYNRFIFAQARAGNDVWQAPPQMTRIGPSPEEDEKYDLQEARVM